MTKLITAAVVGVAAMTAALDAQTLDDAVASQYVVFRKSNSAAKVCLSELDRMQEERNSHYKTLLQSKAQDPDAPTMEEMSNVLAETRAEDAALSERRQECAVLLDQLIAAAKELRRNCEAYIAPADAPSEPARTADMQADNICNGSGKGSDAGNPGDH
jgi:hypothetical protein